MQKRKHDNRAHPKITVSTPMDRNAVGWPTDRAEHRGVISTYPPNARPPAHGLPACLGICARKAHGEDRPWSLPRPRPDSRVQLQNLPGGKIPLRPRP